MTEQASRPLYRVRDFSVHYSKGDTRKVKGPWKWVPLPTSHDTKGFRRLLRKPNGLALYGAWCCILAVSVKCDPPGTLRDSDGPLTAEDISDKCGAPCEVVSEAIAVLSDPAEAINWLEVVTCSPEIVNPSGDFRRHPEISGDPRKSPPTGQDRTEQNRTSRTGQEKQDKGESATSKSKKPQPPSKSSVFSWINAEDLRDVGKLIEWHRRASRAPNPVIGQTDQDRLNVVATAVKCWDKADDPVKLFAWTIGGKRWDTIREVDEDTAHRLIKQHLAGGAAAATRKGGTSSAAEIISDLFSGQGVSA